MEHSEFKIHVESMLKGLQGLTDEALKSVRKSFENKSKEDLQHFEDALKSSKVEEIVKENINKITQLNKEYKSQ